LDGCKIIQSKHDALIDELGLADPSDHTLIIWSCGGPPRAYVVELQRQAWCGLWRARTRHVDNLT